MAYIDLICVSNFGRIRPDGLPSRGFRTDGKNFYYGDEHSAPEEEAKYLIKAGRFVPKKETAELVKIYGKDSVAEMIEAGQNAKKWKAELAEKNKKKGEVK